MRPPIIPRDYKELDNTRYSDRLDAIKDLTELHDTGPTDKLSRDYLLADFVGQDKLVNFIVGEQLAAKIFKEIIPDKEIAQKAYNFIMMEVDSHAILRRNTATNNIVMGVIREITKDDSLDQAPTNEGNLKKIMKYVQNKDEKEREKG